MTGRHEWGRLKVVMDALMSDGWVEVGRSGVWMIEAMDAGLTGNPGDMFGHWQMVGSL